MVKKNDGCYPFPEKPVSKFLSDDKSVVVVVFIFIPITKVVISYPFILLYIYICTILSFV